MATYTHEDLIRYLYRETSAEKSEEIELSLLSDPVLREEYEGLKKTHQELDEFFSSPSAETIHSIMRYAAKGIRC